MLSKRRARLQRLILMAYDLPTHELEKWLTNAAVCLEPGFLLTRIACLRIYTSRTEVNGLTYARQRDFARARLGLLPPRLQPVMPGGSAWKR